MKTPQAALAYVEGKVEDTWQQTIVGNPDGWPLRVPLGKPTKDDLETRFSLVQRWAIEWRTWADAQGLVLDTENRLSRGTRQQMPTHVTVPNLDTAAQLIGGQWPSRLARARARYRVLADRFPASATADKVRYVEPLSDTDFGLLCNAATWFANHDGTGRTPRQVPIEGLHGKWLNRHRAVLTALAQRDALGLVDRPPRIGFTYLDPQHLADGGRRHDSVTIGDPMTPAYPPTVAVITENKDTALFFPPLPKAIAVEGGGFAGAGLLWQIPWLTSVPNLVYWGDIDAAGYEIVNRLRGNGLPVHTVLMDLPTYVGYERYGAWTDDRGNPLPCVARKDLAFLTPAEREVYDALTDPLWERSRRVEQERIPLVVAHRAVTAELTARS